jgi:hypothetical protein
MPFGQSDAAVNGSEPEQVLAPTPEEMTKPEEMPATEGTPTLAPSKDSPLSRAAAAGPALSSADQPEPSESVEKVATKSLGLTTSGSSEVRLVSHNEEAAPADGNDSRNVPAPAPSAIGQWKKINRTRNNTPTTGSSTSYESDSNSASASSAGTASGWKRM